MKKYYKYAALILLISTVIFACREKYLPPQIDVNSNYLVVEGVINTGTDSTIIKLSRTVKLSNTIATKAEPKATVTVESSTGTVYTLPETAVAGTYGAPALGLTPTIKYHVKIKTSANKTYQSDFVDAYTTPPIDSLYFKADDQGAHILANTHNTATATRYYLYSFDETYQYHAAYQSFYVLQGNNSVVPRDMVNNSVYTCWRTLPSTNIITASAAKLTQNIINQAAVTDIPLSSQKLMLEYSINLKQYAISEEAYNFWTLLKKNTESLGSIFDAQPTQLQGNIHNTADATEPVFGYIGAGTLQQKRIFIFPQLVPGARYFDPNNCTIDTAYYNNPVTHQNDVANRIYNGREIPIDAIGTAGFYASDPICTDCTLGGGKNKKPAFWK